LIEALEKRPEGYLSLPHNFHTSPTANFIMSQPTNVMIPLSSEGVRNFFIYHFHALFLYFDCMLARSYKTKLLAESHAPVAQRQSKVPPPHNSSAVTDDM
jgi:hypothetical protein